MRLQRSARENMSKMVNCMMGCMSEVVAACMAMMVTSRSRANLLRCVVPETMKCHTSRARLCINEPFRIIPSTVIRHQANTVPESLHDSKAVRR